MEATRGPLCILAGAGTGKTTTITRRIALQVESGAFRAGEILAVTFTDKAAGVLRSRLARLGVRGVEARTFHSAALSQLYRYVPDSVGRTTCRSSTGRGSGPEARPAAAVTLSARFPAGVVGTVAQWIRSKA